MSKIYIDIPDKLCRYDVRIFALDPMTEKEIGVYASCSGVHLPGDFIRLSICKLPKDERK